MSSTRAGHRPPRSWLRSKSCERVDAPQPISVELLAGNRQYLQRRLDLAGAALAHHHQRHDERRAGGQHRVQGVGLSAAALASGCGCLDDSVTGSLEHVAEDGSVGAGALARDQHAL